MSLSKNAFALRGWLQYWGDKFAGAKDHASLEHAASECDMSAPEWVTQEYLFKARELYFLAKERLDKRLKG
jgi:hypothetical protein